MIDLADHTQEIVQCTVCGVAQDGSLICFVQEPGAQGPIAIKGYAPGQWVKFSRSMLRSN
jgi:hypothetical protein